MLSGSSLLRLVMLVAFVSELTVAKFVKLENLQFNSGDQQWDDDDGSTLPLVNPTVDQKLIHSQNPESLATVFQSENAQMENAEMKGYLNGNPTNAAFYPQNFAWPSGVINNNNLLALPNFSPISTNYKPGLTASVNNLLVTVLGLVSCLLNMVLVMVPLKLPLLDGVTSTLDAGTLKHNALENSKVKLMKRNLNAGESHLKKALKKYNTKY